MTTTEQDTQSAVERATRLLTFTLDVPGVGTVAVQPIGPSLVVEGETVVDRKPAFFRATSYASAPLLLRMARSLQTLGGSNMHSTYVRDRLRAALDARLADPTLAAARNVLITVAEEAEQWERREKRRIAFETYDAEYTAACDRRARAVLAFSDPATIEAVAQRRESVETALQDIKQNR